MVDKYGPNGYERLYDIFPAPLDRVGLYLGKGMDGAGRVPCELFVGCFRDYNAYPIDCAGF